MFSNGCTTLRSLLVTFYACLCDRILFNPFSTSVLTSPFLFWSLMPPSFCWDRFPNPFCEIYRLPACLFNSVPSVLLVQTCLQSNLFKIYRCVQAVSCSPQILPRQQPFFLLQYAVKPTPKSMQTDSKNLLHGIDGPHSRIELMMLPFF